MYYRFFTLARNDAGVSPRSDTITLLAATENSEVTGLECSYQDEYMISLQWAAPTESVGSQVVLYQLEVQQPSESQWSLIDELATNVYSVTSGIQTGSEYSYRVRAVNEIGTSPYSNTLAVIAARVPTTPSVFSLLSSDSSQISFQWQEPYSGGSPITHYKVWWDNASGSEFTLYAFTVGPDNTFEVNTGLIPGQSYSFKVIAVNLVGESLISDSASYIAAAVPGQPGKPYWIQRDVSSILLEWTASETNGDPIHYYNVYSSVNTGLFSLLDQTSSNQYLAEGLSTGN